MLAVLSGVELFQALPADGLTILVREGQRRSFSSGSHLMLQGELGTSLHVILEGLVRIERWDREHREPLVLAVLGPGEVIGEMGVLDGAPRSATVTAIEDTETWEITAGALTDLVMRYPAVSLALLRTLSRRLRSTNERVELEAAHDESKERLEVE